MSVIAIRNLLMVASLAVMAALIGWGIHSWNEHEREEGRAEVRAADAKEAAAAAERNAKETQRRLDQQQEVQSAHDEALASATADAAGARDAAGQLQQRVAQLESAARRAACHPAAVVDGQAAADPIGVLAELQRRADERAGVLAEYADRARIAGRQCEADYDALTRGTAP